MSQTEEIPPYKVTLLSIHTQLRLTAAIANSKDSRHSDVDARVLLTDITAMPPILKCLKQKDKQWRTPPVGVW